VGELSKNERTHARELFCKALALPGSFGSQRMGLSLLFGLLSELPLFGEIREGQENKGKGGGGWEGFCWARVCWMVFMATPRHLIGQKLQ